MRSTLPDFITRMVLAAAIALAVAACGGNDQGTRDTETAKSAPTAESGTLAQKLNTPAPTANETVPDEIEAAARKLLANELKVGEGDLKLHGSEAKGWSDTSLGCPQEGMGYAQVLTPGHKLVFDLEGTSYAVHTNSDGSHLVICEDGTPAQQLNTPAPTANETVPDEIEAAARTLLANELKVDEGDLKLDGSEAKGWSDASLGCPQEGMGYAQVLTPGHKLVFDLAGTSYAVHTNSDGSHMVICEDEQ